MRVLVLAPTYPHAGFPFSGVFNARCAEALKGICGHVEVLAPRPYVPRLLAVRPRWKAYSRIAGYENKNGIPVNRPALFRTPGIGDAFWSDLGAFWGCCNCALTLHRRARFDAIISFDLLGAGGLAWRIGKLLDIPACGWATGSDVRVPADSASGRVVIRALNNLDLVFYQSTELLQVAAKLINISPSGISRGKHMVLARGIPLPPSSGREDARRLMRSRWGVTETDTVVLGLGRITGQKGCFELLEAISYASAYDGRITCILVGSMPEFDETELVKKRIDGDPVLKEKVRILPACSPGEVWDILCGADIFAFPSHKEGMPNSLLEAMAVGLPAIAFAIPPVEELERGTDSLIKIPPFDTKSFAKAILELSDSLPKRKAIGAKGKQQVEERFMITTNMACALEKIGTLTHK